MFFVDLRIFYIVS